MKPRPTSLQRLIWATRGHDWGFRFLLDGGLADPLSTYEHAFSPLGDQEAGLAVDAHQVAVRFPDPEGRRDRSGRLIPHDFVVGGDLAAHINSVDDALSLVWPQVASVYARAWRKTDPPKREEILKEDATDREAGTE